MAATATVHQHHIDQIAFPRAPLFPLSPLQRPPAAARPHSSKEAYNMYAPAQAPVRGPLAPSELYTNDRRRQPPVVAVAAPTSPPKKKSSSSKKPQLPSPPRVIYDNENKAYHRGQLLGQGGFARVYEAVDPEGRTKAFKVIAKSAIMKSRKNRQKILAEIMIHRSLNHLHIVKFEDTFEDDENVYFKLELCSNGSLNDIVKKRGSYSEPEARYFMVQILCGCQNMHLNSIIHRDLKLGNIFLDEKMNVKIGDFGLAALLKYPEERKKTVCGTPNYIAPEVLYDQGEGHSFEVDVWSVGVILYTLLVGKPPFQTNDVSEIYEKIKKNDYEIPAKARVSPEAQDLIKRILTHNPAERPTLVQIMNHSWFRAGPIPLYVPSTATRGEPFLPALSQQESLRNFQVLKCQALWNPDADKQVEDEFEEAVEILADEKPACSMRDELREQEEAENNRERMDREFQKAIQPGSPISALLKAGRQPLVKAAPLQTSTLASRGSASALAKQLSSLALSRQQPVADKENAGPTSAMAPPPGPGSRISAYSRSAAVVSLANATTVGDENQDRRMLHQKARLVAGMSSAPSTASNIGNKQPSQQAEQEQGGQLLPRSSTRSILSSMPSAGSVATVVSARKPQSSIESMIVNLGEALQTFSAGQLYTCTESSEIEMQSVTDELNDTRVKPVSPKVFLISWIDHSERYGLGYALSDGTVGVHFRDSCSMVLSATKGAMDYISTLRSRPSSNPTAPTKTDQLRRENFHLADDNIPNDLASKFKVIKYFEKEIMDRLYGADGPLTFVDATTKTGMTFVHKWYRCRDAIVFRLSNSTVQFNFYDHTKLFLTHRGLVISVIEPVEETDGVQTIKSWTLEEFINIANEGRSKREESGECAKTKALERKLVRRLVKKVRYARDILATTISGAAKVTKSASINSTNSNGTRRA